MSGVIGWKCLDFGQSASTLNRLHSHTVGCYISSSDQTTSGSKQLRMDIEVAHK